MEHVISEVFPFYSEKDLIEMCLDVSVMFLKSNETYSKS